MSGGGGLTVGLTCLRAVKSQIYTQSVLNQTCIPPLTQYTQTHKTYTLRNPDCAHGAQGPVCVQTLKPNKYI